MLLLVAIRYRPSPRWTVTVAPYFGRDAGGGAGREPLGREALGRPPPRLGSRTTVLEQPIRTSEANTQEGIAKVGVRVVLLMPVLLPRRCSRALCPVVRRWGVAACASVASDP